MNLRTTMSLALCSLAMAASGQSVQQMSIKDLFERIEQHSSTLKMQATAVETARQGVNVAKADRLPSIDVQASVSYIGNALMTDRDFGHVKNLTSPHFGNMFSVDAQQVVYTGGALSAGIRMAELGAEQAGLGRELTRQQLRFMALGQYLDLQKMAHREEVLKSNIALMDQLVDHITQRQQQGLALKNDITRYELQRQMLDLRLTQLRNTRHILNHQLCNTLGLAVGDSIVPTEDVTAVAFAKEPEQQWQQTLTAVNPQLQMAAVDVQMAQQKERLAKSDRLPKVALMAQNNLNGPITFELPPVDKNINVWFVGVGVKYSLSSLYKSGKKQRQAALYTRQMQENSAVVAEQLDNQMQAAHTQYLQSYAELETQQKSVRLARENYDVMRDRYDNQLVLVTDMVDASNMKLDAELGEADARINIAYAYYKMKFVAGSL